ncbi:winged helix-turn-helix domain-containing protein [Rhodococcus sp. NPDC003318]|uniref:winged helix-turn-helix domain-containing protein n=1 Tax=Rhodococcus sp. NPDC003318 TaxID=3364503 RepID=UPI00369CA5F9
MIPSYVRESSTDLVLTLQFTGSTDHRQLAALAEALRATARELVPGVDALTRLDPVAPLLIDLPAREVRLDGTPVSLSHTEFEILSHLTSRPRVVVSRRRMLELCGTLGERDRAGRSVDVHVSRVRTKLGRFGRQVTTVRGAGYRYDPDPQIHVVTH